MTRARARALARVGTRFLLLSSSQRAAPGPWAGWLRVARCFPRRRGRDSRHRRPAVNAFLGGRSPDAARAGGARHVICGDY